MSETTETIEEEIFNEDAMRNAELGQFENTVFERWEFILTQLIGSAEDRMDMDVAASVLNAYPFLKHDDLYPYMADRAERFRQALAVLNEVLGDKKEKIYLENKDDWTLHVDLYLEVLGKWNKLTREWADQWKSKKPHRVTHATILDVSGSLLSPEFGLVEHIRTLANFDVTPEQSAKLEEWAM